MSPKIHVVPRKGLKVRTENGARHIKPEGESVVLTSYYRRRLKDGDLVKGQAPSSRKSAAPKKAEA
jgi:hypothetical protein